MAECMVIGDSIAVGVAQVRRECRSYSRSGWNSSQWNRDYLAEASGHPYQTVIISLGANDHADIKTESELRRLRAVIQAKRVFWLGVGKERKPQVQAIIERIAREYGDVVLDRPAEISSDGVHPTRRGYRNLADQTR